jgi:proliferating cell nuclear antigen
METQYALEVRTIQSTPFKVLIEALKELLTDVSIEFDDTGMKIITMDNTRTVLVHLKLDASKFEYYQCKTKTNIGVNMLNMYKLIRCINNNDILTLFVEENDMNHLGIRIENCEKNTKTVYKLNLLDLDDRKISIDPEEFYSVITLPSVDFQKICRDMNNIADYVEIKNISNQLILSCQGDFCNQETIISDSDSGNVIVNKNTNEILQGIFNLKFLVTFTKCTNLSSMAEIYLKNDYPLLIKYAVASLGEIKLALAPTDRCE